MLCVWIRGRDRCDTCKDKVRVIRYKNHCNNPGCVQSIPRYCSSFIFYLQKKCKRINKYNTNKPKNKSIKKWKQTISYHLIYTALCSHNLGAFLPFSSLKVSQFQIIYRITCNVAVAVVVLQKISKTVSCMKKRTHFTVRYREIPNGRLDLRFLGGPRFISKLRSGSGAIDWLSRVDSAEV